MPNWSSETDPDVLSEAALAKAQHLMSHAMTKSGTSETQMAVQMETTPSSIEHMLSSRCDLTVRSLGRFLALCGYRLTIEVEELPVRGPQSRPGDALTPQKQPA